MIVAIFRLFSFPFEEELYLDLGNDTNLKVKINGFFLNLITDYNQTKHILKF